MKVSERLDALTNTFSSDRNFCDYLLMSNAKRQIAEMLVYHQWMTKYMNDCQNTLAKRAHDRFAEADRELAGFWTLTLMAGVYRDLNLACYLSLRGLLAEAGSALRRALESVGVLSHLWHQPGKAAVLEREETSNEFRDAFHREPQRERQNALKERNTTKRFEHLLLGEPTSTLYKLFSRYSVHGDAPNHLITSSLKPTRFSCGFENRPETVDANDLLLFTKACQILCAEIAYLAGLFGDREPLLREAGAVITVWLTDADELDRVIDEMLLTLCDETTPCA